MNLFKKREPVWVFLEREMKENASKKPPNTAVLEWLVFLKDLREHYHKQRIKQKRALVKEVGPKWYIELSSEQREVVKNLKTDIHGDAIEELPCRVVTALRSLGITIRFDPVVLMKAVQTCTEDAGVFLWYLFTDYYKQPPCEELPKYDLSSMLMMSALYFIDREECQQQLDLVMKCEPPPPPKPPKPPKKNFTPNVRFGEYLQKMYAPFYDSNPQPRARSATSMKRKFTLRGAESWTRIVHDQSFLEKRKERNLKAQTVARVCNYKFWEPPIALRTKDPEVLLMLLAIKMFKKGAKPRFLKYKPPYENTQCHIGPVTYIGGKANYVINSICILPTGFIPINHGVHRYGDDYITIIHGFAKFPPLEIPGGCISKCDCAVKWESAVKGYLEKSRCKCYHYYDFNHEGKVMEKYFHKPTKHSTYWIDQAKIYQLDPTEDFIKQCVENALHTKTTTSGRSQPEINIFKMRPEELLKIFLMELEHTPLITPHLPNANYLRDLQSYIIKKIRPPLSEKQHKNIRLKSLRQWADIQRIKFTQNAPVIQFTEKEKEKITWADRKMIGKLAKKTLSMFTKQNKLLQIQQARLLWATMKNELYNGGSFQQCFFSYFPTKMNDLLLLEPFDADSIPKFGAKTCPLRF